MDFIKLEQKLKSLFLCCYF